MSFCTTDGDSDAIAPGIWYPVRKPGDDKYNFNACSRYQRPQVKTSESLYVHTEDMGHLGSMLIGPSGVSVVRGGS